MGLQIHGQPIVQIAELAQSRAEGPVQGGVAGARELLFELDQVAHHERPNKPYVTLTQLQLHFPSSPAMKALDEQTGKPDSANMG
jgi:hypothetical protein